MKPYKTVRSNTESDTPAKKTKTRCSIEKLRVHDLHRALQLVEDTRSQNVLGVSRLSRRQLQLPIPIHLAGATRNGAVRPLSPVTPRAVLDDAALLCVAGTRFGRGLLVARGTAVLGHNGDMPKTHLLAATTSLGTGAPGVPCTPLAVNTLLAGDVVAALDLLEHVVARLAAELRVRDNRAETLADTPAALGGALTPRLPRTARSPGSLPRRSSQRCTARSLLNSHHNQDRRPAGMSARGAIAL